MRNLSKFTIKKMLLLFAFTPLFCTVFAICIVSSIGFRNISKNDNLEYLNSLTTSSGKRLEILVAARGNEVLDNYDTLSSMYSGVGLTEIDSSHVYIVNSDGVMIYHPTKDKVGKPVENSVVKKLVSEIKSGKTIEPEVVTYNFNGVEKYAAYYCSDNNDFILVISADESEVLSASNKVIMRVIITSLVISLLFILLTLYFASLFVKPLNNVVSNLEVLADGDLTNNTYIDSKIEEIRNLVNGTKKINDNIGGIVRDVSSVSSEVMSSSEDLRSIATSTLSASEEIAKAIEDVAQNNTNQAGLVTDITSSLSVMQQKSYDIVLSINDIKNCSNNLRANCDNMKEKIRATSQSNNTLSSNIELIQEKIKTTSKTIKKMSEVLETIEDISGQTKLLSLNASIEAARAGEFGNGFSVVANNIQTLATETASELVSIREIIKSINDAFKDCITYSGVVSESNAINQQNIIEVIKIFDGVDSAIQSTTHQVDLIDKAVNESDSHVKQMSDEVVSLGSAAESNAAASEEINASIEELTALMGNVDNEANSLLEKAESLTSSLQVFKI